MCTPKKCVNFFYGFDILPKLETHAIGTKSSVRTLNFWIWSRSFLKFVYSENATKFCEIFTLLLSTVQVDLCQKHLFWHQLTHNMTQDCSLNYEFSRYKFRGQNMLCTQIVCFHFDSQNNLCTQHVMNLEFSCAELLIQWTIFCHICMA